MITTRLVFKCGYYNHVAKKYKILKYLVELYMIMRHGQNAEGSMGILHLQSA